MSASAYTKPLPAEDLMVRSLRNRGKGNKTWPGRKPKARNKARPKWRSRAPHAVESRADVSVPILELSFAGRCGVKAEDCMYLFDQAVSLNGTRYFAEYKNTRFNTCYFTLVIAEQDLEIVSAAAAKIGASVRS